MALNKAKKAILKAKYGDQIYGLLIKAEDVIVTESGGSEVSLADKLVTMLESINGKAAASALSELSGKVDIIIGSDTEKSARQIAGEVLAAAGKLEYKKVNNIGEIKPDEPGADKYIYLVPKSAKTNDKYDEYMVLDGAVEKVGDWDVDLSDYLQKVDGATADDIATLKADGTLKDSGKKLSDFVEAKEGMDLSHNDYSDEEKGKVTASKTITDKLTENADTLAAISASDVASWNGKGKVYVSESQPEGLQNGDLWLQTFAEE